MRADSEAPVSGRNHAEAGNHLLLRSFIRSANVSGALTVCQALGHRSLPPEAPGTYTPGWGQTATKIRKSTLWLKDHGKAEWSAGRGGCCPDPVGRAAVGAHGGLPARQVVRHLQRPFGG